MKIEGYKYITSKAVSGSPGVAKTITIAHNGTDKSWTFIPVFSSWCTIEGIWAADSGVEVKIDPTYSSSVIVVTLLALKLV